MKSVLWTGGFDSTYRVVCLYLAGETVQPVYIDDPSRASTPFELRAMERIAQMLQGRGSGVLLPLVRERAEPDAGLRAASERVISRMYMGGQYALIAACAKTRPGLELCVHKDDKAIAVMREFGSLVSDGEGGYRLAPGGDPDVFALFGNLSFPIADKTKLEMRAEYEERSCSDIAAETWFCHSPIGGEPCGKCNPCVYTVEEGMGYRLSAAALRRYARRKRIDSLKKHRLLYALLRRAFPSRYEIKMLR